MINIKEIIAKEIEKVTKLNSEELDSYIEKPKEVKNGDYAFPCFRLAKELKKAPQEIAKEIASNINISKEVIENVEVVGGYLNFYANKNLLTNEVIKEISSKEEVGSSNIGNGKTIVIDYSSPNIAKPFHIGHLKTTVLGGALYNIYKHLGYKVIGVNHLGDYGTQFGKLIEGYKRWGDEYDLTKDPIDKLAEIYLKINNLCGEKRRDKSLKPLSKENLQKIIKQFLNKNKKWKGRIILINDSRAITEYNAIEFY